MVDYRYNYTILVFNFTSHYAVLVINYRLSSWLLGVKTCSIVPTEIKQYSCNKPW